MKLQHFKGIALMVIAATLITACGGLGKMSKYAKDITYKVDPEPLIVRGDSVQLNVTGKFPGKYFHKKAGVELTPTLVYTGGETAFKMTEFQGENAAGNAPVISYENGKEFSYSSSVAYTPEMEKSEVMVKILGKQGSKTKAFDAVKIADGVRTTPYLMLSDDKVLLGKDEFKRVTQHNVYSQINYLVNSSQVRSTELNRKEIKDMNTFIKNSTKDPKIAFTSLQVDAYASPEGEISLNENLANDRAKSAGAVVKGEMNKNKIKKEESFYKLNGKGEDWDGFKKAMEASNVADKELILRILTMYSDVTKREQEIRNLAATYTEIADKILPDLRRSQMTLNYEITGKSDEEILSLAKSTPDALNVEELLYAATLTTDINEQLSFYKAAEAQFPSDYRGANNVGYIFMMQNKMNDAEAQFNKANGITSNPYSTNNLGVIARLKGDRKKALELLNNATAAGSEVNYNIGLVSIQNGDYTKAISSMGNSTTFNVALAKVLNNDAAGAKTALNAAPEKDSAAGQYLMAVIAARSGDGALVKSSLSAAFAQDSSLREKAKKDLEFRDFKDAVQ
jgi:Flp pilus assembly protein TadD